MPYPYTYPFYYEPIGIYKTKIDWDNDGDFEGTGENVTSRVVSIMIDRGRDKAWELGKGRATRCEIVLDNRSKDYSPEYSSSPLYGDLKPGRAVKIRCAGGSVSEHDKFLGVITDIRAHPSKDKREVTVYAEDGITRLRDKDVNIAVYESILTGAAIGHVLDAAGWSATARSIDDGQTTLLYWWAWNKSALEAIRELEETEMGLFYIDEDGNAVFEDRHHKLKGAHLTSQETYYPDNIPYMGFDYDLNIKEVFNVAIARISTYTEEALAVLWTLNGTPSLAPGESRTWRAIFSYPAVDLATPVASTDYVANSESGGGGTDLTADITISLTALSEGCDLELTNDGSVTAFITLLQQRGKALTPNYSSYKSENAASQADYEKRTYPIPGGLIPNEPAGKDFCDYVVSHYGTPIPRVALTIWNGEDADITEIMTRQISDRVTIKNDEMGLDDEFFIHNKKDLISHNGNIHRMVIIAERASQEQYWVLGSHKLDTETKLGY